MRGFVWILVLLVLIASVSAIPVSDVKLNGYVLDYTNTLPTDTVSNLSLILESLHDQNAAEYVIVIVDTTDGLPIEDYALEIGHNNIGGNDDKGLVTVIALDQREYYTAVGYGLEGDLNDAKIGRFQREELVPFFQAGDYGSGLVALALAIHDELLPNTNIAVTPPKTSSNNYGDFNLIHLVIIFFVLRFIFALIFRKKGKGKGRDANDALSAAIIASMFLRGGGGSGGSGGFGGFSGGGFGGGGSGGGW
jgi:uncharacterized protein